MTRRDIIIISVLINAGLLTLLFSTAITTSDDLVTENPKIEESLSLLKQEPSSYEAPSSITSITPSHTTPIDEVDQALKLKASQLAYLENATENEQANPSSNKTPIEKEHANTVKITVKRGDSLDRIAKANFTTVEAIIKENQLTSTQLQIGETLYLPLSKKAPKVASSSKQEESPSNEKKYYIIEANDNPWKIARKNQVKLSELLKLNNLNEEKARNLKVGDKLRIR